MNSEEKKEQLELIIEETLPALIGSKCVYLDLPYHANVGDVLIWEGIECFLEKNHIFVMHRGSWDTFDFRPIPKDVTIIMHGGGSFGDIWEPPHQFRISVIKSYPQNKIIILPQTVFYYSEQRMREDADLFAQHPNLTICARDMDSYNLVSRWFKNNVVCLPDMAFCIPLERIRQYAKATQKGKRLFLRRIDKEYKLSDFENSLPPDMEIHDWPPLENEQSHLRTMQWLIQKRGWLVRLNMASLVDWYARMVLKPRTIRLGVEFLSSYEGIYSTRLHGAILSILLAKPCVFMNNSYGKNLSFYNSWLSDVEGLEFVNE